MTGSKPADRSRGAQGRGGGRVTARGFVLADRQAGAYGKVDVRRVFHVEQQRKSEAAEWVLAYAKNAARISFRHLVGAQLATASVCLRRASRKGFRRMGAKRLRAREAAGRYGTKGGA